MARDVRDIASRSDTRLVTDLVPHLLAEFPSLMMDSLNDCEVLSLLALLVQKYKHCTDAERVRKAPSAARYSVY